jgi:hypothetical protein
MGLGTKVKLYVAEFRLGILVLSIIGLIAFIMCSYFEVGKLNKCLINAGNNCPAIIPAMITFGAGYWFGLVCFLG